MIVANYLLEIELLDCHTKVIREFVVPADIFLSNLHEIIQIVMGWTNSHMHQFNTVEGCYGQIMYGDDDREKPQDELTTQLKNIVSKENPVFEYIYDMGDDWIHKITVKSFDYTDKLPQMPYCISAVGACPPEDVGGPDGYENFCLAINERKNPEYKEICEWVYDLCGYRKSQKWPDGVSVPKINKTLKPIDLSPAASNAVSADEQSSHFVETVYSWGLHFLEEWKVPPERQKELWRMIGDFSMVAWNFAIAYKTLSKTKKAIKKAMQEAEQPTTDDLIRFIDIIISIKIKNYPDDDLVIGCVNFVFRGKKPSIKVSFESPFDDIFDDIFEQNHNNKSRRKK